MDLPEVPYYFSPWWLKNVWINVGLKLIDYLAVKKKEIRQESQAYCLFPDFFKQFFLLSLLELNCEL